jgi:hypothetical protein
VRRVQGQESVQGTSIGKKKIKIVGAEKSLGLRVTYPSAASKEEHLKPCSQGQGEGGERPLDGGNFRAEMSFSA